MKRGGLISTDEHVSTHVSERSGSMPEGSRVQRRARGRDAMRVRA